MIIEVKQSPEIKPQVRQNNSALHCPIFKNIYTTFGKVFYQKMRKIYIDLVIVFILAIFKKINAQLRLHCSLVKIFLKLSFS